MMSLFKAVAVKHGLGGGGLVGLKKEFECVCLCLVVSRRGKSVEKLGRGELTSGGGVIFEVFLTGFNFTCFLKFKKKILLFLLLKMLLLFQRQPFLSHFPFSASLSNWLIQSRSCGPQAGC